MKKIIAATIITSLSVMTTVAMASKSAPIVFPSVSEIQNSSFDILKRCPLLRGTGAQVSQPSALGTNTYWMVAIRGLEKKATIHDANEAVKTITGLTNKDGMAKGKKFRNVRVCKYMSSQNPKLQVVAITKKNGPANISEPLDQSDVAE